MKAIVVLLLLSGCGFTAQGDFARETVRVKGAQAYDEGIENAEWFLCNAASVGAIRRRYGRDEKIAEAYKTLCSSYVDIVRID